MELGHMPEHTRITGIIGSDQFDQSRRQWSEMVRHDPRAVKDEYRYGLRVAGRDPSDVLARITRRHAEAPLLAGHGAVMGRPLKRLLGYSGSGDVWSIYSGAPQWDGSCAFSAIERCPVVLVFADYTLRRDDSAHSPGGTAMATAVECRVTSYLWGWQRYGWPLVRPLLRSLVRDAIAAKIRGQETERRTSSV